MVFKWKVSLKVPADVAAAELERIFREHGEIDPQTVVDESRPEDAVLHKLFDWDDASAAEKYRVTQARFIIRNIEHKEDTNEGPVLVRSFQNADRNYLPTKVVFSDTDLRNRLMENALRELEEIRAKYRSLSALAAVFEALDEVQKTA